MYSGEHKICNPDDFTWEALCSWIEAMEHSPRLVDRLRVMAMFNHIYGFRSKSQHQKVLNAYRMRKRTLWSEEQKAENKEMYSGFQTYRQDMEEADADGDGEFGGSSCHVFRTQDVTEVYKEVRYCSEQTKTLNSVFHKVGEGGTHSTTRADYPPVMHDVIGSCSVIGLKQASNALRSARPKPVLDREDDMEEEEDDTHTASEPGAKQGKTSNDTNDTVSASEYIASRDLSEGQRRLIDRLRKYFDQVGPVKDRLRPAPDPPLLLMTGDPGAGKSYVIETLVELAYIMGVGHVQTTSFNGIAAVNIDGTTLCRLLSIDKYNPSETDFAKARSTISGDQLNAVKNDLNSEKLVLFVVDEVSTLDSVMLAMIDARLQRVMGNNKKFGGIAMLFCGDFNQLGAVKKMFLLDDMLGWAEYQKHCAGHIQQEKPKGMSKRKRTGGKKPQRASAEKMLRISLDRSRKITGKKDKKINTSLYSRYSVRGMVHHGCKLFSGLERYHLPEQRRSEDPVHMKFVKKLASGRQITWEDLAPYKALRRSDAEDKEWLFAPVLVSSNRERMEIVRVKAALFAKLHSTYVFKWRNKVTKWKNKPQDPSYLFQENGMLWQYFVPGSEAFLTKNINPSIGLANGTPIVCHSLVLGDDATADMASVWDQISGPNALPYGSEIILNEAPVAVNMTIQTGLDGKAPSRAKKRQLEALREHSVAEEGEDIVIQVSERSDKGKGLRMKNGSHLLGNISSVKVTPILAFDLAFSMTIHKAQGRTINRVVIALTSRPIPILQLKYASIFVGMSRVKKSDHIRLLEHGRGSPLGNRRDALEYLTGLLPRKNINIYNVGFPAGFEKSSSYWNWEQSLKAKF